MIILINFKIVGETTCDISGIILHVKYLTKYKRFFGKLRYQSQKHHMKKSID